MDRHILVHKPAQGSGLKLILFDPRPVKKEVPLPFSVILRWKSCVFLLAISVSASACQDTRAGSAGSDRDVEGTYATWGICSNVIQKIDEQSIGTVLVLAWYLCYSTWMYTHIHTSWIGLFPHIGFGNAVFLFL